MEVSRVSEAMNLPRSSERYCDETFLRDCRSALSCSRSGPFRASFPLIRTERRFWKKLNKNKRQLEFFQMCNSLVSNVIPEVSIGVSYIVDAPAAREAEPRGAARHARRPPAGESPRLCGRVALLPMLQDRLGSVCFHCLGLFWFCFCFCFRTV